MKFTCLDKVLAHLADFSHLLVRCTKLVHLGLTVGQLWARSALAFLKFVQIPLGSVLSKHNFPGDEPIDEFLPELDAVSLTG